MESTIPAARLKQLQIIVIALVFGATIFSLMLLVIANSEVPSGSRTDGSLLAMRIFHPFVTLQALIFSGFFTKRILAGKTKTYLPKGEADTFLHRYKMSVIVRLAMMEGNALFGAVLFLNASTVGAVRTDATYYLHFLPLIFLIIQAKIHFPTEEKYNDVVREYGE